MFKPLEPFRMLGDRSDIFLEDALLSGRGTAHLTEPAQVGWASGGAAGRADSVTSEKGFEARLGRFEIAQRIFTGSAQIPEGFVLDLRDIDRREIA